MATQDPKVVLIQLGIQLRRLRERAGLPAHAAATRLGCSTAKISKMENGHQGIKADEVSALLELYEADDSQVAEALRLAAVPTHNKRGGSYRDSVPHWFRRFLVMESEAESLSIYESEVVPGILQTQQYARTLLQAGHPLASNLEIEQQVEARMERKEILTKDGAPRVDVVLNESALHRVFGGDAVMREQLDHLCKLAELPNVTLQVLPFRPEPTVRHDEAFVARAQFVLLWLAETGLVAYIEDVSGATYPEESEVIRVYADAYERLRRASLSPEASVDFIGTAARQYAP